MGDGDGWVQCAAGHRHWGRFGAAGLLLRDAERLVLQHRAPWTHEGDTWGLPGGARDSHEDVVSTALREANEEAALLAASIAPIGLLVDDHGGWSYTTVVAMPIADVAPHAANAESQEIRWWPTDDIDRLPLHQGFASTWPVLRPHTAPLVLVLDLDGEPGVDLVPLARQGALVTRLPATILGGALISLLPRIIVLGGQRRNGSTGWWDAAITSRPTEQLPGILDRTVAAGAQVVLVTDRLPRERLPSGVHVVDRQWLHALAAPRVPS